MEMRPLSKAVLQTTFEGDEAPQNLRSQYGMEVLGNAIGGVGFEKRLSTIWWSDRTFLSRSGWCDENDARHQALL